MKNSPLKRILPRIGLIVAAAIGGWQLTYVIALLPFNMPAFLDSFIEFFLTATGASHLENPEDIETLALLIYGVIATLLVGALLLFGYRALRQYRFKKTGRRPEHESHRLT